MGAIVSLFSNWQTGIAGLGILITTLTHLITTFTATGGVGQSIWTDVTALIAGFGLIFAKDANKTNAANPSPAKTVTSAVVKKAV
jgi:hypothetical protein